MKRIFRRLFSNKEMRAYYKMRRKHRKELIKMAKKGFDFDWCYLHDLTITKIRHMYEYFSAGNNVMECEETPNVIAELKHVLDLQEELDNVFNDKPSPIITVNDNGSLTFTRSDEDSKRIEKMYEREDELYKEIYAYIGEHLRGWWD